MMCGHRKKEAKRGLKSFAILKFSRPRHSIELLIHAVQGRVLHETFAVNLVTALC